ncbi:MAG: DUF6114 domain-containing protein [Halorientalis sp.]
MLSRLIAALRTLAAQVPVPDRLADTAEALSPITRRVLDRYRRFQRWRHERPFGGALVLLLSSVVIGYMPLVVAIQTLLLGGGRTAFSLLFALAVALSGVGALVRPARSSLFGAAGSVFAILSLFTTLGGFFVGTVLGFVGGSLCVAWAPEDLGGESASPVEEPA